MRLCHLVSTEFLPLAIPPASNEQNAETYNQLMAQNTCGTRTSSPVQFVDQECLWKEHGRRLSYDRAVVALGSIPTRRGNLHDYYNFFTWMRFPRSKAKLHATQFRLQEARRISGHHKLTLLDEGGILRVEYNDLSAPNEKIIHHLIYGHAVLEQYYQGKTEFSGFGLEISGKQSWLESSTEPMENYLDAALEQLLILGITSHTKPIAIPLRQLLEPQ
jgi:hypothetical protein